MNKRMSKFAVVISLSSFMSSTVLAQVGGAAGSAATAVQRTALQAAEDAAALQLQNEQIAASQGVTSQQAQQQAAAAQSALSQLESDQMAVTSAPVVAPTQTTYQASPNVSSPTQTALNPGVYTPPRVAGGGSATGDAKKSSALQTVAMVGALGVAAWTGYMCVNAWNATIPYPTSCYFAMASTAAAGFLLASSANTKKAAKEMGTAGYNPYGQQYDANGNPITVNTGGPGAIDANNISPDMFAPGSAEASAASQYAAMKAKLEAAGFKLSPDGQSVTGPDGKTQSLKYATSAEGMAASGMSADQISAAQAMMAAEAKKAGDSVKGVAMVAGSGGGGGGGSGGELGGGGSYGNEDPNAAARRLREQNIVMGKALGTGADTRGIASDDMFRMVHERYKAQDQSKAFLEQ